MIDGPTCYNCLLRGDNDFIVHGCATDEEERIGNEEENLTEIYKEKYQKYSQHA